MTESDRIFLKFPDFIKEFIYRNSWDSLRDVQIAAAKTIFETQNDLLLTSSTASGKTEAAFFPVLASLCENMPQSVGVLYIAPLKSLINDQFARIEELLDETGITVTHWHGDVAQSHKRNLLENPRGILQITPESLESLLVNRSNDIIRLFGELRFIIIDEIHTLTGSDRGNQIICQLERVDRLIGHSPRRIGLSATVGDPVLAAKWLAGGRNVNVDVPEIEEGRLRWRLGLEHFYIQNNAPVRDNTEQIKFKLPKTQNAALDEGYEYLYDCVKDKKSLVFSNSREETEYLTATLRQIAKKRNEADVFLIHHGNLSASIREEAEMKMKDEEIHAVTCATVTMELGIDIGKLERIGHLGAPCSVASFLQRLGRSGRRDAPPEMMMVFREEEALPNAPLPQLIPWELIRAIAIIQLYIEDRFIEPPKRKKLPFSLLFHQTLSLLASSGELTPKRLAERILSLPPFREVSKEDYRTLIISMVQNDFLELTEEKGLIVGLAGEKLLGTFKFYAVFKDTEDFTVRCGSDEIGTITTPPPVGDRFALAGRVWEVEETDIRRRLIYVKAVEGKMEVSWPGDYGEIHTRVLERMRRVLCEDTEVYPYLKENAVARLEAARCVARNSGMCEHSLIHLGGYTYCLFPWLGTKSFRTLRKFIQSHAAKYRISGLEFEGCCYMTFRMEACNGEEFIKDLAKYSSSGIDTEALCSSGEAPLFEKYDSFIPQELLKKQYAADRMCAKEAEEKLDEILKEYIN